MKGNRDMFYSNTNQGGYIEPNMQIPIPSGYNYNAQYSSFGPGIYNQNMNEQINPYEERITKLEKQVRLLDQRLRKLETSSTIESETDSNMFMI